jgi:hypothetical protein
VGKIKSAAYLTRRATLATARENYYKNKAANTTTTVVKRPVDTYVYNSYMLTDTAGNSVQMQVQASGPAVTLFGGATALGLVDPATVSISIGKKSREFEPAKVHAMKGAATPTASVSPWGTRVIKYSTTTSGSTQAHYVAPVSGDATSTYKEVAQRAGAIHTAIKGNLGDENYYRFWMSPEIYNVQEN